MRKYPGQTDLSVSEREKKIRAVARRAAAEGMVLLENDGILPLEQGAKLALYGRGARDTIKGGTGSGDVNSRNTISVEQGLLNAGFTVVNRAYLDRYDKEFADSKKRCEEAIYREAGDDRDPRKLYHAHATFVPELPELPLLPEDAAGADAVVYVISRISGEFADRRAEKGDYFLSEQEEQELETLASFGLPLIVLLNVGGVIDLSFMDTGKVSALLLMSQAGSEGGNAAADILSGKVNPSGRLTDTWAFRYEDYPSSATFSHCNGELAEEYYTDGIYVGYRYFDAFGVKPRYPFGYGLSYTSFASEVTGAEETLSLSFSLDRLASWHERQASWILQAGEYGLFIAENAGDVSPAVKLVLDRTVTLETLSNICETGEALREIAPEQPDMDLSSFLFPLPDIRITDAAETWTAPAPFTAHPVAPAVLAKAKEIASRMTVQDKACLVVGARSAMAGEIVKPSPLRNTASRAWCWRTDPRACASTRNTRSTGRPGRSSSRRTGSRCSRSVSSIKLCAMRTPTCVTRSPPPSRSGRCWPRASTPPSWRRSAPPSQKTCGPSASPSGWPPA